MPQRFDILHLLASEKPFALLARAVRDELGSATPEIYDRLRNARRADMEDLVRAAIAHYRALPAATRDAIAGHMALYAHAQSLANLAEKPPLPIDDAVFPTPELAALLN